MKNKINLPKEIYLLLYSHIFVFFVIVILFGNDKIKALYYTSMIVTSIVAISSALVCTVSIDISNNNFSKYISLTLAFMALMQLIFIVVDSSQIYGLRTLNISNYILTFTETFECVSFVMAIQYLSKSLNIKKFISYRMILILVYLYTIVESNILQIILTHQYGPYTINHYISIINIFIFIYVINKLAKNKSCLSERSYRDLNKYIALKIVSFIIILLYKILIYNDIHIPRDIFLLGLSILKFIYAYYVMKIAIIDIIKTPNELLYNKLIKEKEIAEAKNEALSNISHEFKTPVNVIYSVAQMQDLNMKNNNTERMEEFNLIVKQNCSRLVRLINNFIDSTKFESDNFAINLRCTNIVRIVEDISTSVLMYAENRNIELTFDTCEEELFCKVDVEFIERIVLNLLSNAIKYNKENGSIMIDIDQNEDDVIISISDTGIGIPKDKIDKLFNRYDRIDRDLSRHKEGTGIGLNIVKQMIQHLNGRIFVESIEDEGTTVRLFLKKTEERLDEYIPFSDLGQKVELELSDI